MSGNKKVDDDRVDNVIYLSDGLNDECDDLSKVEALSGRPIKVPKERKKFTVVDDCGADDDSSDDDLLLNMSPIFNNSTSSKSEVDKSNNNQYSSLSSSGKLLPVTLLSNLTSKDENSMNQQSEKKSNSNAKEKYKRCSREEREEKKKEAARKKQEAAQFRQEIRESRKRERERTKQEKVALTKKQQQEDGKFAANEIALLIATSTYHTSNVDSEKPTSFYGSLFRVLREKGYEYELSTINSENNNVHHNYISLGEGICSIEFLRRDHNLLGGAVSALINKHDTHTQYMNVVALVVYQPLLYLWPLIVKCRNNNTRISHPANQDYPTLKQWMEPIRRHFSESVLENNKLNHICVSHVRNSNQNQNHVNKTNYPRFMIILSKGDIVKSASSRKAAENILQNVTVWFLMEMNVECIFVDQDAHVIDWICDLTRSLSEAPYYEDATELHCVPKYAKKNHYEVNGETDWIPLLRCFPRMGGAQKPRQLCKTYPTMASLLYDYFDNPYLMNGDENDEVATKQMLVAHAIFENSTSQSSTQRLQRMERKLSEQIYRFFTSDNPNELIE